MNVQITCQSCGGEGTRVSKTCGYCAGTKFEAGEMETIKFDLPKGVEDGMRFAYRQAGNPATEIGGQPGDLYVSVKVREHDFFQRLKEGTLLCKVPLSYTQFVLGGKIDVPTMDGEVSLKIPPGTQPLSKFRLKEKGLPKFNNGGATYRGDQIVQVSLEVPTWVDADHQKVIKKLAKLEVDNPTPLRKEYYERLGK